MAECKYEYFGPRSSLSFEFEFQSPGPLHLLICVYVFMDNRAY